MNIIEYQVLEYTVLENLILHLNNLLQVGWQPIGGISVYHVHQDDKDIEGKVIFYQAIVKYKGSKE